MADRNLTPQQQHVASLAATLLTVDPDRLPLGVAHLDPFEQAIAAARHLRHLVQADEPAPADHEGAQAAARAPTGLYRTTQPGSPTIATFGGYEYHWRDGSLFFRIVGTAQWERAGEGAEAHYFQIVALCYQPTADAATIGTGQGLVTSIAHAVLEAVVARMQNLDAIAQAAVDVATAETDETRDLARQELLRLLLEEEAALAAG